MKNVTVIATGSTCGACREVIDGVGVAAYVDPADDNPPVAFYHTEHAPQED